MTQPCHKDTTLNQQCCDSEHKRRKGEGKKHNIHNETTHTALPFSAHNTATRRRRERHDTRECNARGTGQCGVPDLIRRQGTLRRGRGQHETRGQHTAHPPAIQQDHHTNEKGDTNDRREGQCNSTRPSLTMPPTIHNGTPPPRRHHPPPT